MKRFLSQGEQLLTWHTETSYYWDSYYQASTVDEAQCSDHEILEYLKISIKGIWISCKCGLPLGRLWAPNTPSLNPFIYQVFENFHFYQKNG